jgi:hypothetical protein
MDLNIRVWLALIFPDKVKHPVLRRESRSSLARDQIRAFNFLDSLDYQFGQ